MSGEAEEVSMMGESPMSTAYQQVAECQAQNTTRWDKKQMGRQLQGAVQQKGEQGQCKGKPSEATSLGCDKMHKVLA